MVRAAFVGRAIIALALVGTFVRQEARIYAAWQPSDGEAKQRCGRMKNVEMLQATSLKKSRIYAAWRAEARPTGMGAH